MFTSVACALAKLCELYMAWILSNSQIFTAQAVPGRKRIAALIFIPGGEAGGSGTPLSALNHTSFCPSCLLACLFATQRK